MYCVICIAAYLVGATLGGLLLGRWFYVNRQYREIPIATTIRSKKKREN